LQILECRREDLIDQSGAVHRNSLDSCADGANRYLIGSSVGSDPVVILPPDDGGADMWMDDRAQGSMFLSDRIAKAIKATEWSRR
jgi:hypothetical protein